VKEMSPGALNGSRILERSEVNPSKIADTRKFPPTFSYRISNRDDLSSRKPKGVNEARSKTRKCNDCKLPYAKEILKSFTTKEDSRAFKIEELKRPCGNEGRLGMLVNDPKTELRETSEGKLPAEARAVPLVERNA